MTFVLNAAILSKKSLATLLACSTEKTIPFGPTISEIWLTVVPVDAPKYNTLDLFTKGKYSSSFIIDAANLLLNGSHNLYSIPFLIINFSLYTWFPGTKFSVASFFCPSDLIQKND